MTPDWFLWLRTHAHIRACGDSQPPILSLSLSLHILRLSIAFSHLYPTPTRAVSNTSNMNISEKGLYWRVPVTICLSLSWSLVLPSASPCVCVCLCLSVCLSLRTCCWPVRWRELQWSWQTLALLLRCRETSRLGLVRKHKQWHTHIKRAGPLTDLLFCPGVKHTNHCWIASFIQ